MIGALPYFTRLIAGVAVPNTVLINSSIELARAALPDSGYNHIMLNGQAIINNLPTLNQSAVDQEAFGVTAILHDLGWAFGSDHVSNDRRFEVDGAFTARAFVEKEAQEKRSINRLQLVWDAIALHTNPEIAVHKQIEVAIVSAGMMTELGGPQVAMQFFGNLVTVTQEQWEAISLEFPRHGLQGYIHDVFVHLCAQKPNTTYLNSVGDWGEKYVHGYTRVGHRIIDLFESVLPSRRFELH